MGVSRSYDPGYKFNMLTRLVFLGHFLVEFFSSLNIVLIEN